MNPRTHRLKRLATVACVLLVAVGVASHWYSIEWRTPGRAFSIGISQLSLLAAYDPSGFEDCGCGVEWHYQLAGLNVEKPCLEGEIAPDIICLPELEMDADGGYFILPLWCLLAAVALPLALTGRRYRRIPGLCHRCRYDLRGNVSGVCPECGAPTPVAPSNPT